MKKYKRPTLCSNKLLFPSFTFYVGFMLIFNFLLSLALRFYCFLSLCFDSNVFYSLGCDYASILLLFYFWFVIIFRFFCFLFLCFLFFDGSPIDNLYINNHILVINFIITEPVSVGSVPNSAPNRLLEPVLSVRLAPTRSGLWNRSRTDRVVPIPIYNPCWF